MQPGRWIFASTHTCKRSSKDNNDQRPDTKRSSPTRARGWIIEERKDAVTRLFHIDRCSLLVRSIGRGRAVKAGKTVDVHDVLYFIT